MATVFLGSLQGALGFRQLVAIKRPHPHLLEDRGLPRRAAARGAPRGRDPSRQRRRRPRHRGRGRRHPARDGLHRGSVARASWSSARAKEGGKVPAAVAVRVVLDACAGLHAAHEACGRGRPSARPRAPRRLAAEHPGRPRRRRPCHRLRYRQVRRVGRAGDLAGNAQGQGRLHGARVRARRAGRPQGRRLRARASCCGKRSAGKRLFRGENDARRWSACCCADAPPVSEADAALAPSRCHRRESAGAGSRIALRHDRGAGPRARARRTARWGSSRRTRTSGASCARGRDHGWTSDGARCVRHARSVRAALERSR